MAAFKVAKQSRGAIITAKGGFGLIARSPGFRDEDVTLEKHYQWVDIEFIRRTGAFLKR